MAQSNKDNPHPRRLSRELALKILFQREFSSEPIAERDWADLLEQSISPELLSYGESLVKGVLQYQEQIDQKLKSLARNWKLERMALIDRNLLRLGLFEMLWMEAPLPPPIVINEYVDLAKKYGSTDSGSFVNGILDQAAKNQSVDSRLTKG
ncbi:MAG: transcription antitermination factor NusB [Bdellovibrionaceae bacterium]|nr:transcription antitermination factor NusB [Pseudobdellovibrionaceae bacterium]MDW8190049.1 transcription antitermination factor NusB [Pseudobdellovibrionaceae bacterium]